MLHWKSLFLGLRLQQARLLSFWTYAKKNKNDGKFEKEVKELKASFPWKILAKSFKKRRKRNERDSYLPPFEVGFFFFSVNTIKFEDSFINAKRFSSVTKCIFFLFTFWKRSNLLSSFSWKTNEYIQIWVRKIFCHECIIELWN